MEEDYTQELGRPVKRPMNKNAILIVVIVFVLLIAGMFAFAYLKKQEQQNTEGPVGEDQTAGTDGRFSYLDRIDARHYIIDGTHTLVGEIPMPTPCDLLDHNVIVAESYPEQVTIDFFVINNAETCAEVITPARFMVEAEVADAATFSARLDGRSIPLNLTPAPAGETPDEFELFIKG